MAKIKHALIDLVYNDETGRYIGMLERKLLVCEIDNIKMRALLELLTDESWDDYHFKDEDEEIRKLAHDALKRRLGLNDADASKLVQERWERHNPPPATVDTSTYLIGKPRSQDHRVTHARPIGKPAPYDVEKHLAGLQKAHEHREAYRDQL